MFNATPEIKELETMLFLAVRKRADGKLKATNAEKWLERRKQKP